MKKDEFNTVVKNSDRLVIHFYADWVDQCQHMENVLNEMSAQSEYKDVKFVKLPAEEVPEVSHEYKISAVPTFVLIKSGKEVGRVEGANPGVLTKKLKSLIVQVGMQNVPPRSQSPSKKTDLNTRLKDLINSSNVMLFMKGNAAEPRCGFSRQIVEILNTQGINYKTFDILSDNDVREGLKKYSDWPTYPQLYINGELVGGLDIVKEMVKSGELTKLVPATNSLNDRLKSLINKSKVMVFMKGDKQSPKCGFSRQLVEILKDCGTNYETFDILEDENVRQGLKKYSDWPTYPQLYINGELVGGLDIVKELNTSGELKKMLIG
ncbi:hypothetical protein AAG570_009731 [Ranatra chinensis]|uniref:Thioredoxin domain-containing protein n=1 Tax=Ranatra chinensis TaxID=642074 RepID=A0ABD0YQI6_9HEMI